MIEKNNAKKILGHLLKTGGDFAELFIQKKKLNNLRLDDGKIENIISGFELGCGLRLISEQSTFYAYVDSLDFDKLLNAAKILRKAVNSSKDYSILDLTEGYTNYHPEIFQPPASQPQGLKSSILNEVNLSARNYSKNIIQVSATLSDLEEDTIIANSEGSFIADNSIKVFLAVSTVAKKGNEIRTGYKSLAKTCGYEVFKTKNPVEVALESSRISVTMLDAVDAPAGSFPVVIGPGFGGVIFHEACGHGLEADSIFKDASVFKEKLDKKIANDNVTAYDDATLDYHWGSYGMDGEGYLSQKNVLIENGILRNYIFDYMTAKKMKMKQTGNGRRQSYRDIPQPRMSNTYIGAGKEKPDAIIKSLNYGIYAKEFAGGQVDPATGDFVFGISEGYIIKRGAITEAIKGATLIGNGPDILKRIEAVGNDLDFAPGFCGKGGQSVSNEVGQPTILINKMTLGGTQV